MRALSRGAPRGLIVVSGGPPVPCALGRSGRSSLKREGDGATPTGILSLETVLYRPDRLPRPRTGLPLRPLDRRDGWCDAAGDRNYNRPVRHPYSSSAEALWRGDGVYDVIVVLNYNRRPRIRGRGSAIFLHVARPGFAPTEGCIALRRPDLVRLLARLRRGARLHVT